MFATDDEEIVPADETEDDDEDLEDLDDDSDLPLAEEEEEEDPSLEELLTQRSSARRGPDETEDDDDIMALASERDVPLDGPVPIRVIPVKDRHEFVCQRCRLVKLRSQLMDEERMLCRDCV